MKKLLFTLLFLSAFSVFAQKEAANWYFGDNAGINFNVDTNMVTTLNDGALSTVEGCTTISDTDGNLQLYTDGSALYNANHQIMPNGFGLLGDESSSQSALVVPKPGDDTIYYVFTVGSNQNQTGLNYSEVDMTLNGGLGDITTIKNVNLLNRCSEKISAVLKDCTTGSIWVISLSNASGSATNSMNSFHAFEVSDMGVNTTAVVSTLPGLGVGDVRGNLKFSPNGSMLACANSTAGLFIADFDDQSGIVSNHEFLNISTSNNDRSYGVEFSPNSQLLYVTASNDFFNQADPNAANDPTNHSSALIQYDLTAANVSNSQIVIDERQLYRGGLQLGPNGKIYRALSATYNQGISSLGVIDNPNAIGPDCNYIHQGLTLTSPARQGLPPFIQSFFSQQIDIIQNGMNSIDLSLCEGSDYTLMAEDLPNATYTWYMDGVLLPETDFDLEIDEAGIYTVDIQLNNGFCGNLEGIAEVSYFVIPTATQPSDINICDDNNDGVFEFDFSTQDSVILNGQDPDLFDVRYFTDMTDAELGSNNIADVYENTSNPQTIYARVENVGFRRCAAVTSFQVEVFDTPIVDSISDLEACDDDANAMDGQTEVNLLGFNADVLGSQNASQFVISYHDTQDNANTGNAPLPDLYTNGTPVSETIFVRIENIDNADCFATESVTLTINPIPEAFNSDLYQCDEDGSIDGFTTFNLTEANAVLTNNVPDRSTTFFLSLNDAETDTAPLNSTAYNNAQNPQTVHVKVTNDITGCVNYSELVLEVSTTAISDYVAPEVCDGLNSEDGKHFFNLNDFSTDILSGLPAGLTINYYETFNEALLEQNPLDLVYENTIPYSQTIYVRVENDNACYGINEVLLTVNPLPAVDNDETVLYCLNDFPVPLTISSGIPIADINNYTYSWSNGPDTESILVNEIGTYTVTVTDNLTSCSKSRTVTVIPSNIATVDSISVLDGSLGNNQITVIASGEGEYQYALIDEDGNTSPYQNSNVFTQVDPGIYTVLIRDIKNNCGITEEMVSVIGFPLYFTPNGDSVNDTWQVYGISSDFQQNSIIRIFDRYGKLITQVKASSRGWDGTYNGNPLPQSDYWFSVTLQDGRVYQNHFTLKR